MKIYTLGTHSDWFYEGGAWGKPGLQRIADFCVDAGISRLYWRTHNGGTAKYPSKVCRNADGAIFRNPNFTGFGTLPKSYFTYATYCDYSQWDQLTDMAEVAGAMGLEYCHWYTIFEDDHGGHHGSEFLEQHPELRCQTRDGEPIPGCLDFWFPQVREYKRQIVKELLAKPAKRMLLDFVRRNGKPSADPDGNYRYGYNPEKLEAFQKETGLDALALCPGSPGWTQWLEFNARPLTEFILEVTELARAAARPVDLLVWPVDQMKWMAFDLPALVRAGAVEEVLVGSHTYSYSPAEVHRQLDAIRPQLEGSKAIVVPGLPAYHEVAGDGLEGFVAELEREHCDRFVLFESNALLRNPISERLQGMSRGKSHHARGVTAVRTQGTPDWAQVPVQSGFIKTFSRDDGAPRQETSFQTAHDGANLYLRVVCKEKAPENLLPVPCANPNNYNMKQLGSREFWDPFESIHLFLDYRHQHQNFVRFMVDPANDTFEGQRIEDPWGRPWTHTAKVGADEWVAELAIPLKTLEIEEASGKVLGFHLVRVQDQPREVSAWFNTRGRRMIPEEFGHLTLE